MTDSPSGPVHTRETGLEHAPDTQITPRSKHPHLLRLEQRAPSGAGVMDRRPLTRSASGRSLTPTPQFGAPKTWRNRPKERSANPRKALDRPHSFRDDLRPAALGRRRWLLSTDHFPPDQRSPTPTGPANRSRTARRSRQCQSQRAQSHQQRSLMITGPPPKIYEVRDILLKLYSSISIRPSRCTGISTEQRLEK